MNKEIPKLKLHTHYIIGREVYYVERSHSKPGFYITKISIEGIFVKITATEESLFYNIKHDGIFIQVTAEQLFDTQSDAIQYICSLSDNEVKK